MVSFVLEHWCQMTGMAKQYRNLLKSLIYKVEEESDSENNQRMESNSRWRVNESYFSSWHCLVSICNKCPVRQDLTDLLATSSVVVTQVLAMLEQVC